MGQTPEEIKAEIEAARTQLEQNVERFNAQLSRTTNEIKHAAVRYGVVALGVLGGLVVLKLIRRRSL